MKFSSIIRRALKPRLRGRKIKQFHAGHWSFSDEGTHTITNVHFGWKTKYGEDWQDRDIPTYMISVRAVNDSGDEILVDLPGVDLEQFDRESDRINHKIVNQ